jgi:hypothetical protein
MISNNITTIYSHEGHFLKSYHFCSDETNSRAGQCYDEQYLQAKQGKDNVSCLGTAQRPMSAAVRDLSMFLPLQHETSEGE